MMLAALTLSLVLAAPSEASVRRAVVVGSNSAIAGRNTLRYAHRDASSLAEVLRANGGFTADEVVVLSDAKPNEVLAALDGAREALRTGGGEGLLLFYYSGHADQEALYPGGEALLLEVLRSRLADQTTGVRVGIIDACRGGGWTQAKGLVPTASFKVGVPQLSSEGLALLAASSGLEDAHEAESLQGSFFTHHLVAGLRGAADTSADGRVTLSEAFAYANRLTIRDTAAVVKEPQHPSFDLRLRGRQDVVLTALEADSAQLVVEQREGPLEVVQLSTGVTVVEAMPGERVMRVALPPGPYLVRRVTEGEVRSRQIEVKAHEAVTVDESALTIVGMGKVPAKGVETGEPHVGAHELTLNSGPGLGLFGMGWGASLAYGYFFQPTFGLRATALYANAGTSLVEQLQRDFAVSPTALLQPEFSGVLSFAWAPRIVRAGAGELRFGLDLGAGAATLTAAGASRRVSLMLQAQAELIWQFARLGSADFGARVFFTQLFGPFEKAIFSNMGVGFVLSLGGSRRTP